MQVERLALSFLTGMEGFKRTKVPDVLQVQNILFLWFKCKNVSVPAVKNYHLEPPERPPKLLQALPWASSSISL